MAFWLLPFYRKLTLHEFKSRLFPKTLIFPPVIWSVASHEGVLGELVFRPSLQTPGQPRTTFLSQAKLITLYLPNSGGMTSTAG